MEEESTAFIVDDEEPVTDALVNAVGTRLPLLSAPFVATPRRGGDLRL